MPSGMDDEVEAEANWKRFSREDVGFKPRERTSSEPEWVAGSSKMHYCDSSALALSNSVDSFFPRTCPLCLSHSQHRLILSTFGIIMDDQKLRQPPTSIPYGARPRSRGSAPPTTPPSVVSSANLGYRLHPFLSSHYHSPTHRSQALPL